MESRCRENLLRRQSDSILRFLQCARGKTFELMGQSESVDQVANQLRRSGVSLVGNLIEFRSTRSIQAQRERFGLVSDRDWPAHHDWSVSTCVPDSCSVAQRSTSASVNSVPFTSVYLFAVTSNPPLSTSFQSQGLHGR